MKWPESDLYVKLRRIFEERDQKFGHLGNDIVLIQLIKKEISKVILLQRILKITKKFIFANYIISWAKNSLHVITLKGVDLLVRPGSQSKSRVGELGLSLLVECFHFRHEITEKTPADRIHRPRQFSENSPYHDGSGLFLSFNLRRRNYYLISSSLGILSTRPLFFLRETPVLRVVSKSREEKSRSTR